MNSEPYDLELWGDDPQTNTRPRSKALIPDVLPEDLETERSFLATCGSPGGGAKASEAIAFARDTDFMHPAHKAVLVALKTLSDRNEEIQSLTIKGALEEAKSLNRVGGYPGLTDILSAEDVERPMVLGKILRKKADLRQLIHIAGRLLSDAGEQGADPHALATALSSELAAQISSRPGKGLVHISEVGDRAITRLDALMVGDASPGVSPGLPRLTKMLAGGFKPGQLVILAARPGVGKTTLAAAWARFNSGTALSAIFTLEMADEEIWTRLACSEAGVDSTAAGLGAITIAERDRIGVAREELRKTSLLVSDQASITVPEIRAQVERAIVQRGPISLVVVDYLQLISSPGNQGNKTEATRVGDISRGLKLMAKDLGVPVLILSQLNREVEKRQGGKPQLSDLRDSGAIEQDADIVLFLHRNAAAASTEAEIIVAKNRNGAQGSVFLEMDLALYRFRELERETLPSHISDGNAQHLRARRINLED